jgi:hypothetical protein
MDSLFTLLSGVLLYFNGVKIGSEKVKHIISLILQHEQYKVFLEGPNQLALTIDLLARILPKRTES